MTPNFGNTISKHDKGYEEVFIKKLLNSGKVRKVVAIYKTTTYQKVNILKN